jgi:DNA modification methylase
MALDNQTDSFTSKEKIECLIRGDSLFKLRTLPENSVDAVVTDPPYGLSFMGKKWDYDVPSVQLWREVFRVLKPGGHVLSFGGTRTYHRMVVNIEDAGFEIRDQVQWLYGSGFPKSHNLDGEWKGFGTALKPANEPICLARKPLEKGLTVAENVLKYGTGALNIDGTRVGTEQRTNQPAGSYLNNENINDGRSAEVIAAYIDKQKTQAPTVVQGRWPANIILDEDAAEMLDEQSGPCKTGNIKPGTMQGFGKGANTYGEGVVAREFQTDAATGASRFFYVAKASKRERNAGLEGMPEKRTGDFRKGGAGNEREEENYSKMQNHHPTVKPTKLMEYLIKLITPPGGTVLDCFMGSGSTGVAAKNLGFNFVGIELNEEYFEIAKKRMESV